MSRIRLPAFLLFIAILPVVFLRMVQQPVYSVAGHIVISEIAVSGGTGHTNDEFVELYNPTGQTVDLTGWQIIKQPADGSPENTLVNALSGSIPSHGFFLITHPESFASPSANALYTTTSPAAVLAANNTVTLRNAVGADIDLVGMGSAAASESAAAATPPDNGSIERKANGLSDADSMISGADQSQGNGEDTDNNANDFIVRSSSEPQSLSSSFEPPEPTSTPEPTNTPTPTTEPTNTPTPEPTATVTPTQEPSPTPSPTEEPTPSPTGEPSSTPTPTPSEQPTSTPTPTQPTIGTPTPTPTAATTQMKFFTKTCYVALKIVKFGWFTFGMPYWKCQ